MSLFNFQYLKIIIQVKDESDEIDKPIDHGKYHKETHHKETVTSEEEPSTPGQKGHHKHRETVNTTKTVVVEESSQEVNAFNAGTK